MTRLHLLQPLLVLFSARSILGWTTSRAVVRQADSINSIDRMRWPRQRHVAFQSSASDQPFVRNTVPSNTTTTSPTSSSSDIQEPSPPLQAQQERRLDLPWSDLQEWALRDQLPRYTVQLPVSQDGQPTMQVYTLWRTMSQEVTELTGYPLEFLRRRAQNDNNGNNYNNNAIDTVCGQVLPFLDDFLFENAGGLSGRVVGVAGVADGTRIETTPVGDVQVTVPRGFVRTADGSVVYELGRPAASKSSEQGDSMYSFGRGGTRNTVVQSVTQEASAWAGSLSNVNAELKEANVDADLVRLGGLTAIVLGSALAVDMLSHHLTVNVFWV